ncbi:MAG: FtsX-like permease family protein [Tannerellaceae bacterium]|nr:FtsX-like permease family protein [Tannerellaceae bacterium]
MQHHLYDGEVLGPFRVFILAKHKTDFDAIRQEVEKRVAVFNSSTERLEYDLLGQPDVQLAQYLRKDSGREINLKGEIKKYAWIVFFLLLIPVLNISGLIVSRVRKRQEELGIRKAFGASTGMLGRQIVMENFLPVFIGGIIGLLFSSLLIRLMSNFFLMSSNSASFVSDLTAPGIGQLINPMTFLYVLGLSVVINVTSALIPAWRVSSIPIYDVLKK